MPSLAEICGAAVAFSYRSIDRLVLTAYIPTLQTPGAMAKFFREVCKKPILSGLVFKWLTDRFVTQVCAFAQARHIPVVRVQGRTRPGEVGQRLLRKAHRRQRWASSESSCTRRWLVCSPAIMRAAGPPTSG
jgi:hypothetical protein